MVRTRTVETSEILDAAERVVAQLGAVGLTIDAVAKEASISKSRVVYDFKSKNALIEALVDRHIEQGRQKLAGYVKDCAGTSHPEFFARLKHTEEKLNELEHEVCLAISASMTNNEAVHAKMRAWVEEDLAAVNQGPNAHAAYVAHMAMVGFCSYEWFGFRTWTAEERRQMMEDVQNIYKRFSKDATK